MTRERGIGISVTGKYATEINGIGKNGTGINGIGKNNTGKKWQRMNGTGSNGTGIWHWKERKAPVTMPPENMYVTKFNV